MKTISPERKIEIEQALLDALCSNKGGEYIAEVAFELLGNPIVMNATNKRILAAAPKDGELVHEFLAIDLKNGFVSEREMANRIRFGVMRLFEQGKSVGIVQNDAGRNFMFIAVRVNTVQVATISISEMETPITEELLWFGEYLGKIMSQEIQKNSHLRSSFISPDKGLLYDALRDRLTDEELALIRASRLLWKAKGSYYLITVPVGAFQRGDGMDAVIQSLMDFFESKMENSICMIYRETIVCLYTLEPEEELDKEKLNALDVLFKSSKLKAMISARFYYLMHIHNVFSQNALAWEMMSEMSAEDGLGFYDDYYPYCMLHACAESCELFGFIHSAIRKIREYDKRNNTNLYGTLRSYVMHGKNPAQTQQELFIHRNTLLYRLKAIKQIGSIDLDDGVQLMRLTMSFFILDYKEKLSPQELKF